jgi:hypothetical protein
LEEAWSKYTKDYEKGAILSIEKLKAKHDSEIQKMQELVRAEYSEKNKGAKGSKDLLLLKRQVKILCKLKQYSEAEKLKVTVEMKEKEE